MRNRYRSFNLCIAFALASVLSLHAQSDRQGRDDFSLKAGNSTESRLSAKLIALPLPGSANDDSGLPDAPSAAKADASTPDPAPSPAVKRESHGAAPAAMGGPLGPDRSVADRNYLILTGAMFGASVLNAEMTMHCLEQKTCAYVPPSLRSRAALYGIGIPADFGVAYLTYYMKKKHSPIWFVPSAFVTAANAYVAVHAMREPK